MLSLRCSFTGRFVYRIPVSALAVKPGAVEVPTAVSALKPAGCLMI